MQLRIRVIFQLKEDHYYIGINKEDSLKLWYIAKKYGHTQ